MKKAVIAFLLFFLTQIVSAACALLAVNAENLMAGRGLDTALLAENPVYSGVALLFGSILLIFFLWLLRLLPEGVAVRGKCRGFTVCLLPLLATVLLSLGETLLLSPLELPDNGSIAVFSAMKDNVLCLLLLCLVGPLSEEAVFRGAVLHNLWRSGRPAWLAVVVSAALFALVHGNWAQALPAFAGGVLFGLFYVRTGGLLVPCVAHVANNTLAVVSLFQPAFETSLDSLPMHLQLTFGSLLLALSTAVTLVWWLTFKHYYA